MKKTLIFKTGIILSISGALFFLLEFSARVFLKDVLGSYGTMPTLLQTSRMQLPHLFDRRPNGQFETNVAGFGGLERVQAQSFHVPKKKGIFRIFCMGESSVHGFPFAGSFDRAEQEKTFPGQLQKIFLRDFENVEVINAGVGAVSSSALVAIAEELTQYEPDAVIFYGGHNDYGYYFWDVQTLKTPAWKIRAGEYLDHLYLYRLICRLSGRAASVNNRPEKKWLKYDHQRDYDKVSLFFEKKHKNSIPEREWRTFVRTELMLSEMTFRENLSKMETFFREKEIQFLVCTLVSNLKDFPPLFSFHSLDLSKEDLSRWREQYELAKRSLAKNDFTQALRDLEELEALDEEYAETHYWMGLAFLNLGDYDRARERFIRAKDLSPAYAPFQRAPSSMNELIRRFTKKRNTPLIDLEKAFYDYQPNFGIPGNDLFWDNLHPNERGYRLIAELIAQKVKALRWIPDKVIQN